MKAPVGGRRGPTQRSLEVPGGHLAALEAESVGEPLRGPALLVPGYLGSKEDFLPVMPALARGGHRVWAFDQRGQFESSDLDGGGDTLSTLGRDVIDVAGQLSSGPVHIVGHSFGGLVARAAVLEDRTSFRSLTLLSSGPAALAGARGALINRLARFLSAADRASAWQVALRLADLSDLGIRPPSETFLRRRFDQTGVNGLIAMATALLEETDRVDELRSAGVQILVLCGERDDGWPIELQANMARRLDAPHFVIPRAAHSPALEQPDSTAGALLGFWKEVEDRDEAVGARP